MSSASTTVFLPFTLTLRAPAIATALSGDPNSAVTQPFIPGGAIRGAVAARLLAEGEAADGEWFRNLILTGAVRYLHAYPEIDGQRAIPVPQSWRSDKARPESVWDLASFSGRVNDDDELADPDDRWPDKALVSVGAPFTAPSSSSGRRSVSVPRLGARLHQQRDRVKGRPWTERTEEQEVPRGAIFAYEYLEPGQTFCGSIQVCLETASLLDEYESRIRKLLDGRSILVGRSRRAGYGGDAELRFESSRMETEYGPVSAALEADLEEGQRFRLLLVSAYIGRNPITGQLDPNAIVDELRQRGLAAAIERRCWSFETVGSFNRKWRLEVPQARAATAGSVFVLRAEAPIQLSLLRRIEREGLGERRVEGFGRVLFLRHDEKAKSFRVEQRDVEERTPGAPKADQLAEAQLAFVERRIVLSEAWRELDRVAADIVGRVSKLPTTSLLGRIRTLFRTVRDKPTARRALGGLRTWCDDGGDHALKPEARKKLEACKIGDQTLLAWLRALAQPEGDVDAWSDLVKVAGSPSTLTALAQRHHLTNADAAQRILDEHAAELTVYLVDGVLAAMARRNRGAER